MAALQQIFSSTLCGRPPSFKQYRCYRIVCKRARRRQRARRGRRGDAEEQKEESRGFRCAIVHFFAAYSRIENRTSLISAFPTVSPLLIHLPCAMRLAAPLLLTAPALLRVRACRRRLLSLKLAARDHLHLDATMIRKLQAMPSTSHLVLSSTSPPLPPPSRSSIKCCHCPRLLPRPLHQVQTSTQTSPQH